MGRVGGNYFAHTILDINPEVVPLTVIVQTWEGDSWVCNDDGGGLVIAPLDRLPKGTVISEHAMMGFLEQQHNRSLVEMVLSAWIRRLINPNSGRVYVVAPPEVIAWCVYCVALALPVSLTREFTFSTYERSVLLASAWLLGTWGDAAPPIEALPSPCAIEPNICWSAQRGRIASVADRYAADIVNLLARGGIEDVKQFVSLCERCEKGQVLTAEEVRLVWRYRSDPKTRDAESTRLLLKHPGLIQEVLITEKHLDEVVRRVLDDTAFADVIGPALQKAIGDGFIPQSQLIRKFNDEAVKAAINGDLNRLRNAHQSIRGAETFHTELVEKPLATLSPDVRQYLRPMILRIHTLQIAHREAWLIVNYDRLDELLVRDDIKDSDAALGLALCLASGESLPESVSQSLASRHELRILMYRILIERFPKIRSDINKRLYNILQPTDLQPLYRLLQPDIPQWLLNQIIQDEALLTVLYREQSVLEYLKREVPLRRDLLTQSVDKEGWPFTDSYVMTFLTHQLIDHDCYCLYEDSLDKNKRFAQKIYELNSILCKHYGTKSSWSEYFKTSDIIKLSDNSATVLFERFPDLARHWIPTTSSERHTALHRLGVLVNTHLDEQILLDLFLTHMGSYKAVPPHVEFTKILFHNGRLAARVLLARHATSQALVESCLQQVPPEAIRTIAHELIICLYATADRSGWSLLNSLLRQQLLAIERQANHQLISADIRAQRIVLIVREIGLPLINNLHSAKISDNSIDRLAEEAVLVWARPGWGDNGQLEEFLRLYVSVIQLIKRDKSAADFTSLADLIALATTSGLDAAMLESAEKSILSFPANERNNISRLLFDKFITRMTDSKSAESAYDLITRLDQLPRNQDGHPAPWITQRLRNELADPQIDFMQAATRRRVMALILLHLRQTLDRRAQLDEMAWIVNLIKSRPDAAMVFGQLWRCTDDWPDELAQIWIELTQGQIGAKRAFWNWIPWPFRGSQK
jgi:hypothetical protein